MPYLISFNFEFLESPISDNKEPLVRNLGENMYSLVLKFINHSDTSLSKRIHEMHGSKPLSIWVRYDGQDLQCSIGVLEECVKDALEKSLAEFSSKRRRMVLAGRGAFVKYDGEIIIKEFEEIYKLSSTQIIVGLRFETPTSFRQKGRQIIFPIPYLVFGSIARKWNAFSPIKLPFSKEIADNIMVSKYNIFTKTIYFANAPIKGFLGDVFYNLHRIPVQARKIITSLCSFAEFCGVGYKTTMGMGRVRFLNNKAR